MRIREIDGLRGLAILSVILFHAFARWPPLVPMPYGNTYAPYFGWGWLGVELFFIISGFVIFMTLDKCSSFGEFMFKRWLRLFPAMLIATVLIVSTAPFMNRPNGIPSPLQIVPGLTFIDEGWLHVPALEGTFWSLYAEMKFYVIAGLVYFGFGRRAAIYSLIGGFVVYWLSRPIPLLHEALYQLNLGYWGWFACGALFYEWSVFNAPEFVPALFVPPLGTVLAKLRLGRKGLRLHGRPFRVGSFHSKLLRLVLFVGHEQGQPAHHERGGDEPVGQFVSHAPRLAQNKLFVYALIVGLIASASPPPGHLGMPNFSFFPLIGFPFVLLFAAALTVPKVQRVLTWRPLLFVGFISYPLYLIHEQALIGLTQMLGNPFVPVALIMGAAFLIAKCEKAIRHMCLWVTIVSTV